MTGAWTVGASQRLADEHLGGRSSRWAHVCAAGGLAETLVSAGLVSHVVATAAWLHDLGYARDIAVTGFHALDGAKFLAHAGAPAALVGLVAHHTGARYEAFERALTGAWSRLPEPVPEDLEALTLVDLVVSPSGEMTAPADRLAEVLRRYPEGDPVHLAVKHSRPMLLDAAARARSRLGLSDEWPAFMVEGMGQPQPH